MRYVIRQRALGQPFQLNIEAAEYERYKKARAVLTAAFAIEENYEILMANYREFETSILEAAVANMTRDQVGYGDFLEARVALNRRLINLFTVTRLFLDHWKRHVAVCAPDKDTIAQVDAIISEQYDAHREYRFMDSFRNYAQHQGIPIHLISHASNWMPNHQGERELMRFSIELLAEASVLRKEAGLKPLPLSELEERTDLILYTRRYIECLSTIQDAVRRLIGEVVNEARSLMEGAHKKFKEAGGESSIGLGACAMEDEREVEIEHTALFIEWDDVRVDLQKRNRKLVNLHRRYVTSESTFARKGKK